MCIRDRGRVVSSLSDWVRQEQGIVDDTSLQRLQEEKKVGDGASNDEVPSDWDSDMKDGGRTPSCKAQEPDTAAAPVVGSPTARVAASTAAGVETSSTAQAATKLVGSATSVAACTMPAGNSVPVFAHAGYNDEPVRVPVPSWFGDGPCFLPVTGSQAADDEDLYLVRMLGNL